MNDDGTEGLFFGGRWSPIGWTVGFLRCGFATATEATLGWRRELSARFGTTLRVEPFGCGSTASTLVSALCPLETPPKREILLATSGDGWVVHLQNNHLGGDSQSWVAHLSSVIGCHGIRAMHVPAQQYEYPATALDYYEESGVMPVRQLFCGVEEGGRWVFRQAGQPLAFETPERYRVRPVSARFDRALLVGYLGALGIGVDEGDFVTGESLLIEIVAEWTSRVSSLDEVRMEYGIAPRSG